MKIQNDCNDLTHIPIPDDTGKIPDLIRKDPGPDPGRFWIPSGTCRDFLS
jgi:hypothetical protein